VEVKFPVISLPLLVRLEEPVVIWERVVFSAGPVISSLALIPTAHSAPNKAA